MSTTSVAVSRAEPAIDAQAVAARLRARAVVAVGVTLIVAGLMLLVMVETAGVRSDGRIDVVRHLVAAVSAAALLGPGALMLARVPRHPIGWILCAAALGMALKVSALQYATYSHFVDALPAGVWVGWLGGWASVGAWHSPPSESCPPKIRFVVDVNEGDGAK